MNRNKLILLTAVLLLLAGGGWFLHDSGFFQAVRSLEALRAYIAGFAPYSHLLFFLVQFLSVVFAPIPSNIVAAAGGVLFGTLPGFLITFTAVASASLVTFSLARVLGREFAGRIVSKKLSEKYQGVLRTKAPVFLTLAFLFPFFPDDLLCILAGLTDISFRRFFLLALIARPWGLLVACMVGSATLSIPWWGMALLGAGGLAVFLLAMKYGDRVEQAVMDRLKR